MDSLSPKVLLIGADRYCLAACVRLGLDAVVVVGNRAFDDGLIEVPAPLRMLRVEDQTSAEGILLALDRAGLSDVPWHTVHTGDERALVTASLLARHFGLRTNGPETTVRFRD